MKKMKKIVALILAAASIASLSACSSASSASSAAASSTAASSATDGIVVPDSIKSAGTIVMSTNAEFAPFEYKDGNNIVGIDVDIAQKIADKLGVQLKINDVDFTSLVTELQTGKCDFVAAGMTVTDDRKQNVDFSDTYFDATQSIIVKSDSSIKSRTDLNGKTVGVQEGTTGDDFCTNQDGTSDINVGQVKRYNKATDAVTDLLNGRVDAVVIDDFPAQKLVSQNSDKLVKLSDALTVEEYAIAVQKGDTQLLKDINTVLEEMKNDGELDAIIQKYKSVLEGD